VSEENEIPVYPLKEEEETGEKPQLPKEIVYLSPDEIMIPEDRITAVYDQDLMEELIESIKQNGILEPLQIAKVDGQYILIDGLHRLYAAKQLNIDKVPCIVKEMSWDRVFIENIIMNRQRGKSNPAEEAKLIKKLIEEYGYSIRKAAETLGMSPTKANKLYKIANMPDEVLSFVASGRLPVEGAYYITFLNDPQKQIEVAQDAINYGYTVEMIKARVQQELNPEIEIQPGSWTFTEEGEPVKVPLKSDLSGEPIEGQAVFVYLKPEEWELVKQFWQMYTESSSEEGEGEQVEEIQEEQPQPAPQSQKSDDWWPF